MKKFAAALLVTLALAFSAFAQSVAVTAHQVSDSQVYFTVSNNSGKTVCVFPYVDNSQTYNVNGSVVPMVELGPNEGGINIGAFAQANPNAAWSVDVEAKYGDGNCPSQ